MTLTAPLVTDSLDDLGDTPDTPSCGFDVLPSDSGHVLILDQTGRAIRCLAADLAALRDCPVGWTGGKVVFGQLHVLLNLGGNVDPMQQARLWVDDQTTCDPTQIRGTWADFNVLVPRSAPAKVRVEPPQRIAL